MKPATEAALRLTGELVEQGYLGPAYVTKGRYRRHLVDVEGWEHAHCAVVTITSNGPNKGKAWRISPDALRRLGARAPA